MWLALDADSEFGSPELLETAIVEDIPGMFQALRPITPDPPKRHLLRQLVKKVLVHDRRTVEVWYGPPNPHGFEHCNNWLLG